MKVLIAGGSGLIGSSISHLLTRSGYEVVLISRNPAQQGLGFPAVPWEETAISDAAESSRAVINLAGASLAGSNPLTMRWTPARRKAIINSRVESGQLLTRALQASSRLPEVLIQASAIGYYGNTGPGPVDESGAPGQDFLTEVCLPWEESTRQVEDLGLRRVVARIGLVLSRQGGLLPLLALPYRLYLGGRIGTGRQSMSWIHMDDITSIMSNFLENTSFRGVYNLTAPEPVSNTQFGSALGSQLKRPHWLPVPGWALKLALGEAATLALDGREVLPGRLQQAGYQFHYSRIEEALANLYPIA